MQAETFRNRLILLLPVLVFAVVFWSGLGAWFQQDDFAHLQLAAATPLADLPAMLAKPIAQGTFRPLSERLFYWGIWHVFGLEPLPGHILCFLLQAANCLLLGWLLWRRTESLWGAALGATAWAVQPALALPMTWIAATNQVMWAFCVLATLACFEQNRLRWAWLFYLLGFGVLESNIVVPALLTLWAWPRWRTTIPFWIPAILFAAAHALLIPKAASGTYGMYLDWHIFETLLTYWRWTCRVEVLAVLLLIAGVAVGRFGLAWFLLALGPVLLLREHRTDYYLTVPAIGLAFVFAAAWRKQPWCAALLLTGYLAVATPQAWRAARAQVDKSRDIKALVLGVGQAQKLNPGKTILLDGIGDTLFWSGVYDNPFALVAAPNTKLTPESAAKLTAYSNLFRKEDYAGTFAKETTEVYRYEDRRLFRTTESYAGAAPRRIELGLTVYSRFLGPEWHAPEIGFRWMPARATATMESPGANLQITGSCLPGQTNFRLSATWDNQPLGEQAIPACPKDFTLQFPLPTARQPKGTITLTATPTIRAGADQRDLGAAIRSLEIH